MAIHSKIGQLYEDEVKDDNKAIARLPGDPRRRRRRAAGAAARSTASTCATSSGRSCADDPRRELTIVGRRATTAAHVELKFRLGQLKEQHLDDVAGAIDAYRDILDIDAGARAGRARRSSAASATTSIS